MGLNTAKINDRVQHFELYMSKPTALLCAINEERIRKALKKKTVTTIVFKKLNGDIRTVVATSKIEYIPTKDKPNGRGSGYTEMQVRFYDAEIQAWRSCLLDRIIDIY